MNTPLKTAPIWSLLGVLLCIGLPTQAQLHFDPIGKAPFLRSAGEIGVGSMTTDIETESSEGLQDFSLERDYIYGSVALDLNEIADAIFGLSYQTAEDLIDTDGNHGFSASFGLRAEVYKKNDASIHTYGQLSYFDQTLNKSTGPGFFDNDSNSPSLNSTELSISGLETVVGAVYAYTMGPLTLFGGIEIVPFTRTSSELYTKYELTFTEAVQSTRETNDFDRADPFSGKIGARIAAGSASILADATFSAEETFRLSIAVPF